jgi:predicted nucleic acid-binding protein
MNGISVFADTNPLVYLLDGKSEVAEFLDGKQVWISFITELELFGKRGLSEQEISAINELVDNCFVSDINSHIKSLTKQLLQQYKLKIPDAIIAATALYLDLPLLTADSGFRKIHELKLILLEI